MLDQPGYDIYAVGISDYYYDDDRLENDFIFYDSDTRYLTDEKKSKVCLCRWSAMRKMRFMPEEAGSLIPRS
ncbi:MAG: hypothetical protein ACLR2E_07220 [Lachnospiraceae bacterium]